jgi:hypothetical protein
MKPDEKVQRFDGAGQRVTVQQALTLESGLPAVQLHWS